MSSADRPFWWTQGTRSRCLRSRKGRRTPPRSLPRIRRGTPTRPSSRRSPATTEQLRFREAISFVAQPPATSSVQRPAVQQRTPRSRSSVPPPRGAAGAARGVAARDRLRAERCGVRLLQRPVRRLSRESSTAGQADVLQLLPREDHPHERGRDGRTTPFARGVVQSLLVENLHELIVNLANDNLHAIVACDG